MVLFPVALSLWLYLGTQCLSSHLLENSQEVRCTCLMWQGQQEKRGLTWQILSPGQRGWWLGRQQRAFHRISVVMPLWLLRTTGLKKMLVIFSTSIVFQLYGISLVSIYFTSKWNTIYTPIAVFWIYYLFFFFQDRCYPSQVSLGVSYILNLYIVHW